MCSWSCFEACEGGAAKRLPLQDREPYLDLIELGRACRREMKLHIGMGLEPMLVLLVGVKVVEDDVKLLVRKSSGDGYTFVEKLQTISTKFRKQQADGSDPVEFMRHYYDAHGLLKQQAVQKFIGTTAYIEHKKKRFRQGDNQNIAENEAFLLSAPKTRAAYAKAYADSSALYYKDKPTFEQILGNIAGWVDRL
jgi:hypothetical protein